MKGLRNQNLRQEEEEKIREETPLSTITRETDRSEEWEVRLKNGPGKEKRRSYSNKTSESRSGKHLQPDFPQKTLPDPEIAGRISEKRIGKGVKQWRSSRKNLSAIIQPAKITRDHTIRSITERSANRAEKEPWCRRIGVEKGEKMQEERRAEESSRARSREKERNSGKSAKDRAKKVLRKQNNKERKIDLQSKPTPPTK